MAELKHLKLVIAPQIEALRKSPSNGLPIAEQERRQEAAIDCAALLLGSFRKCDADAPEVFSRAIEYVLARYEVDVQREVTKPGMWKWPPSAYEVREACEKIGGERARIAKREADLAHQLAERRRLDALEAERKALPAPARKAAPPPEPDYAKRAMWDLSWRKTRRESPSPTVFEMDPESWND